METPLVTIGITCFNAENTISRAIASALEQDWPNIEIVIVDDVSTDASVGTINAAIVGDPRARLVRHERNTGPAGARNTILREARGDFVAFFDDDDESLPGRIFAQVNRIFAYEAQTGASLAACYVAGERHYPNGYIKPRASLIPSHEINSMARGAKRIHHGRNHALDPTRNPIDRARHEH